MTTEILVSILAMVLSLCASYLPGFSTWYESLETIPKRQVMGAGLLLIGVVVFVISCAGYASQIGVTLTCNIAGGWIMIKATFAGLAVNQATYLITRKPAPALPLNVKGPQPK